MYLSCRQVEIISHVAAHLFSCRHTFCHNTQLANRLMVMFLLIICADMGRWISGIIFACDEDDLRKLGVGQDTWKKGSQYETSYFRVSAQSTAVDSRPCGLRPKRVRYVKCGHNFCRLFRHGNHYDRCGYRHGCRCGYRCRH